MTTAYREASLPCPGCRTVLAPEQVGDAIIDVCDACGGIWVDWFDGDLVTMVRSAHIVASGGIPDRRGDATCPRCRSALSWEHYQEGRGEVLRCSDCAGAFVPRTSVPAIVALAAAGTERAPLDALSRLASVLQRWLGWEER